MNDDYNDVIEFGCFLLCLAGMATLAAMAYRPDVVFAVVTGWVS